MSFAAASGALDIEPCELFLGLPDTSSVVLGLESVLSELDFWSSLAAREISSPSGKTGSNFPKKRGGTGRADGGGRPLTPPVTNRRKAREEAKISVGTSSKTLVASLKYGTRRLWQYVQ